MPDIPAFLLTGGKGVRISRPEIAGIPGAAANASVPPEQPVKAVWGEAPRRAIKRKEDENLLGESQ
jgi:hypothetical protein